jgi:serine/threonine protein phosphatase 1
MIAVIGDVHGCFNTLKELVGKIKTFYPEAKLYCVGDLVDRGNFSFETVDYVIKESIISTSGNHDLMFYYFITNPDNNIGKSWVYNGYESTLASYSTRQDSIVNHLNYIFNQPLYINLIDCFISHAGVSDFFKDCLPINPLRAKKQFEKIIKDNIDNEHGIIWNRDTLLDLGKLQIVGHTRQETIKHVKSNNVVYIDTSVYTGNKLSAVIIESGKIIDTLLVKTLPIDIEK